MRFWNAVKKIRPAVWGLIGLLAALAISAGFTLGSLRAPHRYWQADNKLVNEPASAIVKIKLAETNGEKVPLSEIWVNFGAVDVPADETAKVKFWYSTSSTTENWYSSTLGEAEVPAAAEGGLYRWVKMKSDFNLSTFYEYIKITSETDLVINEVAFVDKNGDLVEISVENPDMVTDEDGKATDRPVRHNQSAICDEQSSFFVKENRVNALSARESVLVTSAWNMLKGKGFTLDETAPPLAQMLIAAGVAVFGATTLGARVVPFLFGLGVVALLFLFGRRLLKSDWYGLLFSGLFVLSGLGLAMMLTASVHMIATFFVLLAFYFLYEFWQYGVDSAHKFASVVPVVLSGIFFALALVSDLASVYALAGLACVFAFVLIRQYKAYRARAAKAERAEGKTAEKAVYTDKLFTSLIAFVAAYGFGVFVMIILSYGIVFKTYGLFYGTKNLFKVIGESLSGMLGRTPASGAGNAANAFGWLVNFRAETLFPSSAGEGLTNAAYAMSNIALLVLSLACFLYVTVYMISSLAAKSKLTAAESEYYRAIRRPYLLLLAGFLSAFLFYAFRVRAGVTAFLLADCFYIGFIVLAAKSAAFFRGKTLFAVRGRAIAAIDIVCWSLLAVVLVFFALMLPGIWGITLSDGAAKGMFGWFVRG